MHSKSVVKPGFTARHSSLEAGLYASQVDIHRAGSQITQIQAHICSKLPKDVTALHPGPQLSPIMQILL